MRSKEEIKKLQTHLERVKIEALASGLMREAVDLNSLLDLTKWILNESCPLFENLVNQWQEIYE